MPQYFRCRRWSLESDLNMKYYPAAEQVELDRLSETWNKFKSLMLERESPGSASVVQSLFFLEFYMCSSGVESGLGIPTSQLRIFDSFLARFEDQCMLRIFLKFDRFKLISSQEECNGGKSGCESEAVGSHIDEKIQFTLDDTEHESSRDDFILRKDESEHELTREKSEKNEEIRTNSVIVTTEDRNEKDNMAATSAVITNGGHSLSVSEQAPPSTPYVLFMTRPENNSKDEIFTENCKDVISISDQDHHSLPEHYREKVLQDCHCREISQGKTSLMKSSLRESFYQFKKYEDIVNFPGKSMHTLDHRIVRDVVQCLECGFLNENARLLKEPVQSHTKSIAKHCYRNCSTAFTQETNLAHHTEPCLHCRQKRICKFESATSVDDNLFSTSDELPKQNTSNCKMSFGYEESAKPAAFKSDSKIHFKNTLTTKQLKCEISLNNFQRTTVLKRHKRTHKGGNPYVQNIRVTAFADRPHLNGHLRTHPGKKPFKCGVCEADFSEPTKLKYHKRVHTGEKPFICEVCGVSFLTMSSLKSHMKIHSGEKPYKCDVCDFASAHSSNLKAHLLTHSGEKKYSCDTCSACFTDNAKLKRHTMVHTGEKPYRCEACGATFADKSHLTVHLRIHSGEKPFRCTFCSAAFVESSKLKKHLRTHTGEKPYICEVCGMSFAVSYGLKSHMRRHTGEKLYKCNICAYATSQSSNLKTHMSVHNGARPHVCDMCGATFSESSKLTRHRITHLDQKE